MEVDRADMPPDLDLKIGDELEIFDDTEEETFLVVVSKLTEDKVTLDCFSPLAGETLVFDLELVAIG